MKRNNTRLALALLAVIMMLTMSCAKKENTPPPAVAETGAGEAAAEAKQTGPVQLPVRFQVPSYFAQDELASDMLEEDTEDYEIKVGANITSTKGPQPLWDILKRLANLRGMNVSWASDVDQDVKVDVDIRADDSFFEAIDNMLRQVDYFHEVSGNTIIVKYRETKQFHIALPNIKSTYKTNIGGDFIGGSEDTKGTSSNTKGLVQLVSEDNEFDVWQNIKDNLTIIMENWRTQITEAEYEKEAQKGILLGDKKDDIEGEGDKVLATRRISLGQPYFMIDKSIGIITVTAPRPLLEKIENYLKNIKNELYRQVVIEAKIIEVYLQDNSKIGIDWSEVLKNFEIRGAVEFGTGGLVGQVWPWNPPDEIKPDSNYPSSYPNSFVYTVGLDRLPFTAMLNALNEQGDATVLSNPKITVINGQPAVISVGKGTTYIKKVTKTTDEFGNSTFTVEPASVVEGIALGVTASIINDDTVNLFLSPVTTELLEEPIQETAFTDGTRIGLPKVSVREMATMVQVKNGEMLIIGGLIDSTEQKNESFAPIVGNIPLVRYLFGVEEKRMEKRELVILLTPKII
jgi:general secretion pathway protein D/MSHA biogenesis protein MshL